MAQPTTKTSTEVAPADNLPAPRARTAINPIVPQNWQEVVTIASAICRANMAPKSYCKVDNYGKMVYVDGKPVPEPEKVAIAIMHGMEVGLTPMASLQSLAVINGMPSVFGDGLLALIRASGLLEDVEEFVEYDKDGPLSATCKMWRKGEKTPSIQTYTRADAMKAKLWGKAGPWSDHPARMLQWRARGWCGRDKFADVLRGLHSAEEVEDMIDITPQSAASTAPPEPQRSDYQPQSPSSPATTPHSAAGDEGGQPGKRSDSGAGGDSTPNREPEAASTPAVNAEPPQKPNVTDVQDLNDEPIPAEDAPVDDSAPVKDDPSVEFQRFGKTSLFLQAFEDWIKDPRNGPKNGARWLTFYEKAIKACESSANKDTREYITTLVTMQKQIIAGHEPAP